MSKEDWAKFDNLAEQEQMQLNIAKKQKNTDKMILRVVELTMELSDLRNELYYIEKEYRATNSETSFGGFGHEIIEV